MYVSKTIARFMKLSIIRAIVLYLTLFLIMVKVHNMNNVTSEKKQSMMKGLAVAGLLAIIIISALLAVQLVQSLPKAIDSLASIATSVYNYNPLQNKNIEVTADKTFLKTDEMITLSWPEQNNPGIYTFSYTCQDNISLSLSTSDKNIPILNCDKDYELGTTTAVVLSAQSDAKSMVDVEYKVAFFRPNDSIPKATHNGILTIANPNLASNVVENIEQTQTETPGVSATSTPKELATSSVEASKEEAPLIVKEPVILTKPVVATTTSPVKTPIKVPAAKLVAPTPVYIYEIPISDPNGTIDLATTYLGAGVKSDNGFFTKTSQIKKNTPGAFQFAVHNIGTKTSLPWTFTASLPGNEIFNSSEQSPLKPNERAVITIEFSNITMTGTENVSAIISTKSDKNNTNNGFRDSITVIK